MPHVLRWPVRDGLLAYLERLKEEAAAQYAADVQIWATLFAGGKTRKKEPPKLPAILRR